MCPSAYACVGFTWCLPLDYIINILMLQIKQMFHFSVACWFISECYIGVTAAE